MLQPFLLDSKTESRTITLPIITALSVFIHWCTVNSLLFQELIGALGKGGGWSSWLHLMFIGHREAESAFTQEAGVNLDSIEQG